MAFIKLILVICLLYGGLVLYAYLTQRELIYFPDARPTKPVDAGVPEMEIVSFKTRDNLSLSAWYTPPKSSSLPTIIYFHGNAGNIADRAPLMKPYLDQGFGVLLTTYRGYSGNPGIPTEYGLYNDARGAVEFILREQTSPCIFLMGNSIGSAVAIQIATEPEYPVKGLILQSPFTSLVDIGKHHYWYLPVASLAKDKYDSFSKTDRIKVPTLIIQGLADTISPPEYGRKLFQALPHPKEIEEIPGKGHNTLFEPELVIQFVNKYSCR